MYLYICTYIYIYKCIYVKQICYKYLPVETQTPIPQSRSERSERRSALNTVLEIFDFFKMILHAVKMPQHAPEKYTNFLRCEKHEKHEEQPPSAAQALFFSRASRSFAKTGLCWSSFGLMLAQVRLKMLKLSPTCLKMLKVSPKMPNMTPTQPQHSPNMAQLGPNMDPQNLPKYCKNQWFLRFSSFQLTS